MGIDKPLPENIVEKPVNTKATNNGEQSIQQVKANTGEGNRAMTTNIASSRQNI